MGFAKTEEEWEERARRYLKAKLKHADVKYAELAETMKAHGFTETEASITNKLKRGKFSATFMFAALASIGVAAVALEDL